MFPLDLSKSIQVLSEFNYLLARIDDISFREKFTNVRGALTFFIQDLQIVKTERCLYYATRVNEFFQDGSLGRERATVLLTRPITIQWAPSNFV